MSSTDISSDMTTRCAAEHTSKVFKPGMKFMTPFQISDDPGKTVSHLLISYFRAHKNPIPEAFYSCDVDECDNLPTTLFFKYQCVGKLLQTSKENDVSSFDVELDLTDNIGEEGRLSLHVEAGEGRALNTMSILYLKPSAVETSGQTQGQSTDNKTAGANQKQNRWWQRSDKG